MKRKPPVQTVCGFCEKVIFKSQVEFDKNRHHFCDHQCHKMWDKKNTYSYHDSLMKHNEKLKHDAKS